MFVGIKINSCPTLQINAHWAEDKWMPKKLREMHAQQLR